MSAPTVAVRTALAQAGEKGLAHIATQANTGTWLGRCGRQVRGRDIRTRVGLEAILFAETHADDLLCPDCRALAEQVGNMLAAAEAGR